MLGHGASIGYTGPGPRTPDGPHWQFQSGDGVGSECCRSWKSAVANVVTEARTFDHITSPQCYRDLHWLPVRQRIRFNWAMTVYKCSNGLHARASLCNRPTTACRSRLRLSNICSYLEASPLEKKNATRRQRLDCLQCRRLKLCLPCSRPMSRVANCD